MSKTTIGGDNNTPNKQSDYLGLSHEQKLAKARQDNVKQQSKLEEARDREKYKRLAELEDKYRTDRAKFEEESFKLELEYQKELELEKLASDKRSIENRKKLEKEFNEYQLKNADNYADRLEAAAKIFGENLKEAGHELLQKSLTSITSFGSGADKYMTVYAEYMGKIDARLQGSVDKFGREIQHPFKEITNLITNNLGINGLVKQQEVVSNLATLVSQGIAYNVEQRSFLMTVSDKIAETFDAANGTLLRIIRLQQADSTAARLGIEANLTRYLNATFQDTSYLSNVYDSVEAALSGAISQLGRDEGVSFEYAVQKWLGSLSSVGMSNESLLNIAKGVNALVTGDVSLLSGNTALMNLMAMSANRAGIPLGSALTTGLNAENTNKLLKSLVSYTQELAATNNQVVKSKYAELFGLDISDFTAVLNLSKDELENISSNMLSYTDTLAETNSQLKLVSSRTHISEMINNLFENVLFGAGMDIASNPATYMLWQATKFIKDATGGIEIPIPLPFLGTYEIELMNTIQTGIVGISTLGNLIGALGSLSKGGAMSLGAWNATDYTRRGTGFGGINAGVDEFISQSAYIGNADASNLKESAISSAKSDVESQTGDTETELQKILKIMQSWDFGGYGLKVIEVTPKATDMESSKVIEASTISNGKSVTLVHASDTSKDSTIKTIEESDPTSAILALLKSCINNGAIVVKTNGNKLDINTGMTGGF